MQEIAEPGNRTGALQKVRPKRRAGRPERAALLAVCVSDKAVKRHLKTRIVVSFQKII